ncbi:hypothetical protein SASPL_126267 [Salvia splendens]|uniref:L-ascorbate oxidase n=1 Tax=Salvia splendens TaxID=180675 RepID=A0A8X8XKG6_SALSN|nr:hypothetical protein SASPL_126267 [Salvia splendens]
MKLVEVEGTHTVQTMLSSLDVHVGQSYSVLITADQPPQDYHIAVSTRFSSPRPHLHYSTSRSPASGPLPPAPEDVQWSLNQGRSISRHAPSSWRTTSALTGCSASGAAVSRDIRNDTAVMGADYRTFVEIVFENRENILQSWHLDGYSFFVVGMDAGSWTPDSKKQYNLQDAVFRSTTQARICLSQVLDSSLCCTRQCRNVEPQVRVLGSTVPRTAVLSPRLYTGLVHQRRVSHSFKRPSLWESCRQKLVHSNATCITSKV